MIFVLNKCYGAFALSDAALALLPSGIDWSNYENRSDERLIRVVEELGPNANVHFGADLSIVTIPDEASDWLIQSYDGLETLIYILNGKIYTI